MSYEYKELIEQAIIDDDRPLDWEEGFKELDEVYAQATKADEYEAKAKAWDKLSESIRECNKEIEVKDGLNALFRTSKKGQIVQRHIDCFESGEPYAKNDEVDYCTKCTVKPVAKEHMCEECYMEHCQWLRELSAPKQDDDQWYTLYESKA